MKLVDFFYLLMLFVGLVPLFLMCCCGIKDPPTKHDKKDRNPVNRHLRRVDLRMRAKFGKKGIFLTELYSAVAHAALPIGPLLFFKHSSFVREMPSNWAQFGECATWLIIISSFLYYTFVAFNRFRKAP